MNQDAPKYGTPEYDLWVENERQELQTTLGRKLYTTDEVQAEFKIEGFAYYMAYGKRISTGKPVVLDFQHSPRFYWVVREDNEYVTESV